MMSKVKMLLATTLIGALLAGTACAANTAPYSLQEKTESIRSGGKVEAFPFRRICRGITVTEKWVMQARIDGIMIKLQLFDRSGQGVAFQENLTNASEGEGMRLILRQANCMGGLLLQIDQHALDVLKNVGITEIAVVDYDLFIQAVYPVEALNSVRAMLDLKSGEELSVSGLEDPVSVVGENGVRRVISE
ncbi:MAG: hypothetical protein IJ242_17225 [Clostridia bacterium]|nr:hypothetical protein [Clostridia bacterium]